MVILYIISLLVVIAAFDYCFCVIELKLDKTAKKAKMWIMLVLFYIALVLVCFTSFDGGMEAGARKILRKQYTLEYTITQDSIVKDTTIIFK